MPTVTFAHILLENNERALNYPGMYCHATGSLVPVKDSSDGAWQLCDAATYDFTTYFNSLSVRKLLTYTTATAFHLHLEVKGASLKFQQTKGTVFGHAPEDVNDPVSVAGSDQWKPLDVDLTVTDDMVITGFKLITDGPVYVRNGYYSLDVTQPLRPINLALATTTFKKESYITANVALIKRTIGHSSEDIAQHFHMYVIDNGRTLDAQALSDETVTVIPNRNVGGSGGFARGMLAALDQKPQATHVLLMDDDVSISPESIKRTYVLLQILNDHYQNSMISGAMLNYIIGDEQSEDTGYMNQDGAFVPIKPPLRLVAFRDLVYNEDFIPPKQIHSIQRYAAWWYCVIPISAIKKVGMPLPFFVRCDDAEYGYRCHLPLITMNGICIWHMPFQIRYNAAVERYQTLRNTLVARDTTGFAPYSDFIYQLRNDLRLELKKFGYQNARLCLDAFEDYLKGPRFIEAKNTAEDTFLAANRNKEKLVSFDELEKQAAQLGLDFKVSNYSRQIIDSDKPRHLVQRLEDYVTDNGQRLLHTRGKGYIVIPANGWAYPAGVLRGKQYIIVIDWWNKKGAIREKDIHEYQDLLHRFHRDLHYYNGHRRQLKKQYEAARSTLTSQAFWRDYLDMNR
jgi:galactofuranosylgalactofuranosylrhamnosyl-N-acetylglucosaminyl-diphospho-decaprenol beta-1,5/1,6-galactofuranosyltransferase